MYLTQWYGRQETVKVYWNDTIIRNSLGIFFFGKLPLFLADVEIYMNHIYPEILWLSPLSHTKFLEEISFVVNKNTT